MELLQKVAQGGSTVLFTIHQPSSETFFAFDKVILLQEGSVMYSGETKHVVDDFARMGHPVKEHTNPAEWMLHIAQTQSQDDLEKDGFFPKYDERASSIAKPSNEILKPSGNGPAVTIQILNLLRREYMTKKRVPLIVVINVCIAILIGFFSGFLFRGIGEDERTDPVVLQSLVGVFVNCLLNCMMGQSTVALTVLAQERPLFLREYVTKTYSIGSYVLVKLLVELFDTFVSLMIQCLMIYYIVELKMNVFAFFGISMLTSLSATSLASFLGSSVKDTQFALALFPMVILPQFYFSGVLVPLSFIPSWLRWMQYLCSLRYALALCLIYEFEECDEFEKPFCDALLERQQIEKDKEGVYWAIFLTIIVGFKFMSTLFIRSKAQY